MHSVTLAPFRTKRWTPRARTGCLVCRKRRIKCNEAKPSCMQCIKSNRVCPGYDSSSKSPRRATTTVSSYTSSTAPISAVGIISYKEIQEVMTFLPKLNKTRKSLASDIGLSMRDFAEQLIGHLPALSGRSVALDLAVNCVAAGIEEISGTNRIERDGGNFILRTPKTLLESHTAALIALREALCDHHDSLAAETLLAAVLVCCFESFVVNSRDSVVRHMFGISRIIEHRGPSRFAGAVEKDMLRFLLPVVAAISLANSAPCYLAERKWQRAIRLVEPDPVARMSRHYSDATVTLLARCKKLIMNSSDAAEYSQDLIDEHASCVRILRGLTKDFAKSYRHWQASVVPCTSHYDALSYMDSIAKKEKAEYLTKRNGCFQTLLLLLGRLRVALGDRESILIEAQTQQLAIHVDFFHNFHREGVKLFLRFSPASMVESVLSTASEWRDVAVRSSKRARHGQWPLPLVDADVFARWRKRTGLYSEES